MLTRFDLAFSLRDRDTKAVSPAFMEVKGVTLEENGVAMFPDAPTERGIKHLKGLIRVTLIPAAIDAAMNGRQLQPILLAPNV